MRASAYVIAISASTAKVIAIVNAAMTGTPALALVLAKSQEERQEHDDSKVFEIKFSKFQIRQRITHSQ